MARRARLGKKARAQGKASIVSPLFAKPRAENKRATRQRKR